MTARMMCSTQHPVCEPFWDKHNTTPLACNLAVQATTRLLLSMSSKAPHCTHGACQHLLNTSERQRACSVVSTPLKSIRKILQTDSMVQDPAGRAAKPSQICRAWRHQQPCKGDRPTSASNILQGGDGLRASRRCSAKQASLAAAPHGLCLPQASCPYCMTGSKYGMPIDGLATL